MNLSRKQTPARRLQRVLLRWAPLLILTGSALQFWQKQLQASWKLADLHVLDRALQVSSWRIPSTQPTPQSKTWRRPSRFWSPEGALGPSVVDKDNSKAVDIYEQKIENTHLYHAFGAPRKFARRNEVMADLILGLLPQGIRVFEFAGNGGFLPRTVLQRQQSSPSPMVSHWVHSEFSRPVLRYASFLLANETVMYDKRANVDQLLQQSTQEPQVPLETLVSGTTVEVVNIDMSSIPVLQDSIDFSYFQLFVTISFEHFKDDIGMIETLFPKGTWFLFSVPNFDHAEHFRHFDSEIAIRKHYQNVLDIHAVVQLYSYAPQLWRHVFIPVLGDARCKFVVFGRVK